MSGGGEQGGWLPPSGEEPRTDPFGRELPRAEAAPEGPPAAAWGPGPDAAGETADYASRLLAAVIDFAIRLGIVLAFAAVGALGFLSGDSDLGAGTTVIGAGVGLLAGLFYAPIMMARTGGQTVGHRAADTRVVKVDGSPLGFGGAFVREVLVKAILFDGIGQFTLYILTLVNYLWPLWDKKNEALHDKMCSTRVVKV